MSDTIAAISTAPGVGGIGIIRISGEKAFRVASKIFKPKDAFFDLLNPTPNIIKYGVIFDKNKEVIDEVLVSFFKAPNSYTTEDTIEINCHGGMVVTRKILDLVIKNGVKIAEPGEFTKKAFLNGRIDLTQAEAVIDIIDSKSERARQNAINQLKGGLSDKLKEIRDIFYNVMVLIEAGIDYPEHEIEEITEEEIKKALKTGKDKLSSLYCTFDEGKIFKQGVRTVILGKPNVGKSSLMNVLLKEERAIVTDIEGTTRDTIEEMVNVKGVPLCIIDTAGIRETEDEIEEIGVKKSINEINNSDMVIAIFDLSRDFSDEDRKIIELIKNKKRIILINKEDMPKKWLPEEELKGEEYIYISVKDKTGIEKVESDIEKMWNKNNLTTGEDAVISNMRHKELIYESMLEIDNAVEALKEKLPIDMISINIKTITEKIGEILGDNVTEDVIKKIFERFCLGK